MTRHDLTAPGRVTMAVGLTRSLLIQPKWAAGPVPAPDQPLPWPLKWPQAGCPRTCLSVATSGHGEKQRRGRARWGGREGVSRVVTGTLGSGGTGRLFSWQDSGGGHG